MDAQQLPIAAAMLPQRPIFSPVAQRALTRDSYNAQSFGRGTNSLVKQVRELSGSLRRYTSSQDQILLTSPSQPMMMTVYELPFEYGHANFASH